MGRSYTPTYRVEYRDNLIALGKSFGDATGADGRRCNSQAWKAAAPTAANLEAWRVAMNHSFDRGGCNFHVSEAYDCIIHITSARLVRQADGKVICTTTMPMFEVA